MMLIINANDFTLCKWKVKGTLLSLSEGRVLLPWDLVY